MSSRKNKTDIPFRDRLRHYEAAPPEKVWLGIASALQSDKRRREVMWISRIAASIAVLLALGTTWYLLREPPGNQLATREKQEAATREETVTSREEVPGISIEKEVRELGTESVNGETKVNLANASIRTTQVDGSTHAQAQGDVITGGGRSLIQLKTIPSMTAAGLQAEFTDPQILLAMNDELARVQETSEGIDVFNEWGDDGKALHDRWGVGTQVSPIYSYRNLDVSGGNTAIATHYNDVEEGIISYAAGVNVSYAPLKRLSVQSGLYYSSIGMRVGNAYYADSKESFWDGASSSQASINNSTGIIETQPGLDHTYAANLPQSTYELGSQNARVNILNETEGEILQQFEYLELPLILRYRVVDRRLGFHLLGGLSSNFLVGNAAYYQEDGEKSLIGATGNLRPMNYSSIVGMGVDYSISRRFHVNLEPTFRYYLNSINTGSTIKSHPYNIGFFTGLLYTF